MKHFRIHRMRRLGFSTMVAFGLMIAVNCSAGDAPTLVTSPDGADNWQPASIATVELEEGEARTLWIRLSDAPEENLNYWFVDIGPDAWPVSVEPISGTQSGSDPFTFSPDNWDVPRQVVVKAGWTGDTLGSIREVEIPIRVQHYVDSLYRPKPNTLPQRLNVFVEDVGGDEDGDGVLDKYDAFPNDPTEFEDTDNDGVGDNGDMFPSDPQLIGDKDGDGIDGSEDAFPNDPLEWVDVDEDGIGDNEDAHLDNRHDDLGDYADGKLQVVYPYSNSNVFAGKFTNIFVRSEGRIGQHFNIDLVSIDGATTRLQNNALAIAQNSRDRFMCTSAPCTQKIYTYADYFERKHGFDIEGNNMLLAIPSLDAGIPLPVFHQNADVQSCREFEDSTESGCTSEKGFEYFVRVPESTKRGGGYRFRISYTADARVYWESSAFNITDDTQRYDMLTPNIAELQSDADRVTVRLKLRRTRSDGLYVAYDSTLVESTHGIALANFCWRSRPWLFAEPSDYYPILSNPIPDEITFCPWDFNEPHPVYGLYSYTPTFQFTDRNWAGEFSFTIRKNTGTEPSEPINTLVRILDKRAVEDVSVGEWEFFRYVLSTDGDSSVLWGLLKIPVEVGPQVTARLLPESEPDSEPPSHRGGLTALQQKNALRMVRNCVGRYAESRSINNANPTIHERLLSARFVHCSNAVANRINVQRNQLQQFLVDDLLLFFPGDALSRTTTTHRTASPRFGVRERIAIRRYNSCERNRIRALDDSQQKIPGHIMTACRGVASIALTPAQTQITVMVNRLYRR